MKKSTVTALATEAFAGHELLAACKGPPGEVYHAGNPKHSRYGFAVHVLTGHLWLTGDLGNLLVRLPPDALADWMAWLANALADPEYLAGKVVPEMNVFAFDEDAARDYVDSLAASDATRLREAIDQGEYEFRRCLVEEWKIDPISLPSFRSPSPQFYWHVEALRKLLELLGKAGCDQNSFTTDISTTKITKDTKEKEPGDIAPA